jgi:hypothetical protein
MSDAPLPLWEAAEATDRISQHGTAMLEREKERGETSQAHVMGAAAESWKSYCLALIRDVARLNNRFTSDVVMLAMQQKPHDPRALGPLMKVAQKMGYIRPLNEYKPSVRRHATPLRVWESLIYGGDTCAQ